MRQGLALFFLSVSVRFLLGERLRLLMPFDLANYSEPEKSDSGFKSLVTNALRCKTCVGIDRSFEAETRFP
jgi:hypothetical protein